MMKQNIMFCRDYSKEGEQLQEASDKQSSRELKLKTRIQDEIIQTKSYLSFPSTILLSYMKLPEMKK